VAALLAGAFAFIIAAVADWMSHFCALRRRGEPAAGLPAMGSPAALRRLVRMLIFAAAAITFAIAAKPPLFAAPAPEPAPAPQRAIAITGDRLSGFVLPIEPLQGEARFASLRAWSWTVDDTKRLVLDGDVIIEIDGYRFRADQAVVWLNRIPSAGGLINQFALYFPRVSDPTKRAGLGVEGEQVLVTASTRGEVRLEAAQLTPEKPNKTALLRAAENRLAEHLRQIAGEPQTLRDRPAVEPAPLPPESTFVPVPGGQVKQEDVELPRKVELPPTAESAPWLKDPQGIVRWSADRIDVSRTERENLVTIDGSIVVDFIAERANDNISQLTLAAERGVIFTDPGPLDQIATSQVEAGSIRGIYLEGNVSIVAQNGEYIIRTPRAYYDFRRGQAIMLDSWLRLQNRETKIPVHARADEMRQIAANQWDARNVRVSTSEFATPHLALGSQRVMLMERPAVAGEPGDTETFLDADGNTMQVFGVPIVPWPHFEGTIQRVPLRAAEAGTDRNDGIFLKTRWDLMTLIGKEPPEGLQVDVEADAFFQRGAGGGLRMNYDLADAQGALELYGLYAHGEDRTSSGQDVDPVKTFRGLALLEWQSDLSRYWSIQAQLALITDPTFMSSWRESDFTEHREYESALYLKHQRDNTAFTVLGKYSLNDFLANDYLLASRQYSVNKLPEISYRRYGDSLFNDHLTYSTENSVSRMSLAFEHGTPASIGVRPRAFGIGENDPIDIALHNAGLRTNWVNRFDSRHELAMPMQAGAFNVTPFVVGRFTGYDDDFSEFSSDSDAMRFWAAGGVRVSTVIQRVYNGVESQLFDVHRLRHLVEPHLLLWGASSSVDQMDLPIYDEEVESLADGTAVEIGVTNTFQTQRGGPGNWHSVDYFTLDTTLVFTDPANPDESPTPQFFDYRPEYSQFGNHLRTSATWLLSDSLTIVGETYYVLPSETFARGSIGFELRHTPTFITYVEYRFIDVDNTRLLGVDWQYQVTPKYRLEFSPQYDFQFSDLRALSFRVTRSFPDFDLTVQVKYDRIRDDTSLGASLGFAEF